MYVCESLIYAVWPYEALGSLQIDVASPHQISQRPLVVHASRITIKLCFGELWTDACVALFWSLLFAWIVFVS